MLRRAAERKSTRNLNISQISGFDTCLQFAKLRGPIKYSVLTLKSEEMIKFSLFQNLFLPFLRLLGFQRFVVYLDSADAFGIRLRSARVGLGGRASTKYSQPENVSNQCDQNN